MNGIIEGIYNFYEGIGAPAALLPLLPFLTVIVLVFAFLFTITSVLVKKKIIHTKAASFYLFVSVWIIGFLLFTVGPMIFSFYISFNKWEVVSDPKWIGLDNYRMLFKDTMFYKSLSVTFYYTLVSVPLQVILSLAIALLMNLKLRGIYFFRTIYYLPTLVQGVAQMVLFIWIFNPNVGLVNSLLRRIGIEGPGWFSSPEWSMPAVIIMSLWTVGGNMIIYLAGLSDIPQSLYEAAEIDGATAARKAWHVTLPQISPILFFNTVTSMIGAFQTFTQGFMVNGGPDNSLLFYAYYLYQNAFMWFKMGYGSALAWVLFVIILLFTALVFRSSALWVYYETEQTGRRKRRVRKKRA
ncbi:MAG TPA: sugar ABC transporter permease [Paenibacillus sp.]|uniref:carbohydrate ABC transporter permease n=1 Tax=Paenibacillus TaxID=44249 RepID=UPI000B9FD545|nr:MULTISPECIES: sugar ABC transporter permease [Paenibacillus]OZQ73276.1 ABC transporter permease [Paenibacillus taichungensis]HBU82082.1 sugar ABC transporter permease [Paenibacillus sp.]